MRRKLGNSGVTLTLTSIPARNPAGFLSYKVWDVGLSQPRKRDFPLDS